MRFMDEREDMSFMRMKPGVYNYLNFKIEMKLY
jgi:hypothetical protein